MKIKIKPQNLTNSLFCLLIFTATIVDIFRISNNAFFHLGDAYTTIFRDVVYLIMVLGLLLLFTIDREALKEFIIISVIYILIVLISILVDYQIESLIIKNVFVFFSRILPAFILSFRINDYESAFLKIIKWKWLLLIYIILFITVGMSNTRYYYMNVGYNLLFPTLLLLFSTGKSKIIDKVLAVFSIIVILLFCARGTILVLVPALAFFFLIRTFRIQSPFKRLLTIILIILISIMIIIVFNHLFEYLYKLFPSSRTINYILHGEIMNSSGRDNYYTAGINEIWNHPFKFRGILGDRLFYGEQFNLVDIEGAFAHNVFLELMLQYGSIIGILMALLVLKNVLMSVVYGLKTKTDTALFCICAFIIPSFIIAMTTASYLNSIETALMLGFSMGLIKQYKNAKEILYLSMEENNIKD